MEFRTQIKPIPSNLPVNHKHKLLFMGSCFTENIGQLTANCKFDVVFNPFGISYNPVSVAEALNFMQEKKQFTASSIFFYRDLWQSFHHHGRFACAEKEECLSLINESCKEGSKHLSTTDFLFITLGTAHVYRLVSTGQVVANCHKMPQQLFEREMLSPEAIKQTLAGVFKKIKAENQQLNIVLTLSPVRHWRDGATMNQYSKASLLVAIHSLCQEFDFVHYYPAYEIMMDDLRDYRFYQSDMLHPNETAIQYIWTHFQKTYFTTSTQQLIGQINKIRQAVQHRPRYPESKAHQNFIEKQLAFIKEVEKVYPKLDFKEEKELFLQQRLKNEVE